MGRYDYGVSCVNPYAGRSCCKKRDCSVTVNNSIEITQTGTATGGNGGNGGAAAAADGLGIASAATISDDNSQVPELASSKERPITDLQEGDGDGIDGNNNTVADASGGDGGDANVTQSAEASINNYVIICCDGAQGGTGLTLNTNERSVDIKVDEDGNTYLNGERMERKELKDGTKVYILR